MNDGSMTRGTVSPLIAMKQHNSGGRVIATYLYLGALREPALRVHIVRSVVGALVPRGLLLLL